jgi:hypothetical protein
MQHDRVKAALELDGDYVLGDVLGTGGMGIVYSAIQRSLDRRVAIKIPHPELAGDPFVSRRFRAEARASGRLDHRNIARVIDFGGRDGALFLVMQHVAGAPLEKLVLAHGPMETQIAADLCGQILAALEAAHTAGIIHADIKSGNVLVETMTDGALRAVVIDFGLARFCDEPSSHDARLLSGTPDYLAPELIRGGPPTVASDIYAAGVVLYELLTGTTPFGGGTTAEIFDRQLGDAVVPPSLRSPDRDIPGALEAIVMRALAKDPSTRFTSAAQFGAALRAATPVVLAQPPHLARGTQHGMQTSGFSTEATTRDWQRERIPGAAAVTAGDDSCIQQIRAIVKAAIASGGGDSIVTSYLELARALIDDRQLVAAAAELERGLAILRPGVSARATPPAIWRLQLCLAALYSGLGHPTQARRAAIRGQDDAVRAASTLGKDRAHELLVRLAR